MTNLTRVYVRSGTVGPLDDPASLPIYWSGNTKIFDTFPENSFIDVTDLARPAQLVECMKKMSEDEYVSRMNLCRATFDACIAKRNNCEREKNSHRKTHCSIPPIVRPPGRSSLLGNVLKYVFLAAARFGGNLALNTNRADH
jgi:hypothetical protein